MAFIRVLRHLGRKVDGVHKAGLGNGQVVIHIMKLGGEGHKFLVDGENLPVIVRQHQKEAPGLVGLGAAQG